MFWTRLNDDKCILGVFPIPHFKAVLKQQFRFTNPIHHYLFIVACTLPKSSIRLVPFSKSLSYCSDHSACYCILNVSLQMEIPCVVCLFSFIQQSRIEYNSIHSYFNTDIGHTYVWIGHRIVSCPARPCSNALVCLVINDKSKII